MLKNVEKAESDITPWVECFTEGLSFTFEKVVVQMTANNEKGEKDHSQVLRMLIQSNDCKCL
jgi:hypothetical protein